jgi:hypothetical protein
VSPSLYETARLVKMAPWITGHQERVDHPIACQHADGTWGGPGNYALVPTLSATDALLAAAGDSHPRTAREAMIQSALRGLKALFEGHPASHSELADTVAVEVLVPYLVSEINRTLSRLTEEPLPGLHEWHGVRLPDYPQSSPDQLM